MQVQNFECQIAKAQIGRYLAGDSLADDLLTQLEAHIAKCPDCKQHLAERRSALQAMLTPNPDSAPIEIPAPAKFDLAMFIKSKVRSKAPVKAVVSADTPKAAAFTKPALYSVALGAVLIGMSYASRNMGSLLGPTADRADSSAAATPPSDAPIMKASMPGAVTPPVGLPKSSSDKPEAPTQMKSAFADALSSAAAAKSMPDSESAPAPRPGRRRAPRPSHNSIRVYAPENTP